jgi:hypothetical protein
MPEPRQFAREGSTGGDGAATDPGPADADATLSVAGADVTVSGDPGDAEAAALAAVLVEHLRAEVAADAEESEPRYAVDPWRLAGRLGLRSPARVPNACPSGREWKLAGRATTR